MGTHDLVSPLCNIEVTVKISVGFLVNYLLVNVCDHSHPSLLTQSTWEVDAMRIMITVGALVALAACTSNPGTNATEGAVGGAAVGCGIGAAVTAPLLGVGCV